MATTSNTSKQETVYLERWKDVPGYPQFQASTLGVLRNKRSGNILRGSLHPSNYIYVTMKGSKVMHKIIASTWIPNDDPKNKTIVEHINKDTTDNRVINLRWTTRKESRKNQIKTGYKSGFKRKVQKICMKTNNVLETFGSANEAGRSLGVGNGHITQACQGKRKSAYKFKWAYVSDRDCPDEQWKPIPQHPGIQFSTYGRARNEKGIINDYFDLPRVKVYPNIKINGIRYQRHVLLGELFIGKSSKDHVYNHKDGNYWNCHIDNLEACTKSENSIHAHENGLVSTTRRVEVTCLTTGNKRKFRSMIHASQDGFGMSANWLCDRVNRGGKKLSTLVYKTHEIVIFDKNV
jgi:hypothetical protein